MQQELKKHISKIVKETQTGFIKGRFIGENIRLIYDLIERTEEENIPGLLMLLDFEKAFDSIEWHFIEKNSAFSDLVIQ